MKCRKSTEAFVKYSYFSAGAQALTYIVHGFVKIVPTGLTEGFTFYCGNGSLSRHSDICISVPSTYHITRFSALWVKSAALLLIKMCIHYNNISCNTLYWISFLIAWPGSGAVRLLFPRDLQCAQRTYVCTTFIRVHNVHTDPRMLALIKEW